MAYGMSNFERNSLFMAENRDNWLEIATILAMNSELNNEQSVLSITGLRGGVMGAVSGLKAGAVTCALGGVLLMIPAIFTIGLDWAVGLTLVIGLTYGMMFGSLAGTAVGFLAGGLSGLGLSRKQNWIPLSWFGLSLLAGGLLGSFILGNFSVWGELLGLLCGLLAGWIGQRDFQRVLALQSATDEEIEASLPKSRRRHPERRLYDKQ